MRPENIKAVMPIGKSSRMKDKPLADFRGKPLFLHGLETMEKIFSEVTLVCHPELEGRIRELTKANIITDDLNAGPLGALYLAAKNSDAEYLFIAACDMPFLNEEAIRFMCENVAGDGVVLLNDEGLPEPLHAIYRRDFVLDAFPDVKNGRVSGLIWAGDFVIFPVEKIRRFDPRRDTFKNINTEEELAEITGKE